MTAASQPSAHYDASAATDRASWLERMEEICEDSGYFDPLGAGHWAFFADEGTTLLVTFEQIDTIRSLPGQMPMGTQLAQQHGWSHLCLIADGDTWYRDPKVFRYFDRLVDDAFFEDFDRVVFYGAGMGGYAASAFSVCAPGATVVAIAPRATLDPAVAGWDRRHLAQRRLDFTSRFGYAPDMIEGTGQMFLLFDPRQTEDAMHAALFTKPFVAKLRTPFLGDRIEASLSNLGILAELLRLAGEGSLKPADFHRLWRARRNFGPYLKAIAAEAARSGHPRRELSVCRSVTRRLAAPKFRRRQQELEDQLCIVADSLADGDL